MAEIIYSKNGEMKCTAKSVRYTGSFMGVPQLEVEIDGPVPLGFEVGDYIVFSYDGIRYSIIDLPQVQKQSSSGSVGNAFVYENVVFKSPLGLLSSIDFLDTVLSDNNIHYSTLPVFSFFGDIKDFADRLQANLNRIYSSGWKVTVEGYDDSSNANYDILHDYKEISLSNQNCLDALSIPYETWKITYVFMLDSNGNNCIVFNHALDAASAKSYGKGNGLYSLTKRMSAEKPVITRLRAYGSTDNLPARYYNNLDGIDDGIYLPNLMIPRSKWKNQNDPITAYIDSTDIDENDISMSRYGVREKSIYFDGSNDTEKIEPTIKGVTAGMIRAAKEEMGDTSNVPYATLYPDDERMDKIVEAESIADKGVESDGEVYMDSIGFDVSKGEDRTVVGTKNGLDPIIEDLETSMEISTPATYKVVSGNPTPFCRFNIGVGFVVDSAILNVYTVDEDGVKTLCDSVKIYSEFISGVNPGGGRYAYRDFYFAGSNGKDSPLYIKVPYKGVLLFQYNIDAGGVESVSLTMSAVSLTASTGPIILQNKFWVRIKQIGFDINSYPSTGEAKLVVNSGGCAGRSFNIVKNSTQFDEAAGTWKFECFRSQDESLNQLFPNSIYKISEDDEFVLTGLEMPDLYVQMASQKLYDEAVKWLWKHKDGLEVFELDIDNKVAYLDSVKIKEGMLLPLYDGNLNVGSEAENEEGETVITYDYRIIDSVTIEIGEEPVPVITAVLREEKEERIFKLLNKKVSEITARTTQNAVRMQVVKITEEVIRTTASTSVSTPSAVINTSDFVTLSTDQTITGKKTFANDVIFGGEVSEGVFGSMFVPSTEGPGKYALVFDSASAVDGEIPTEMEGLDVDAMWEELSGSAGSQVIAKEHLPSDVVYGSGLAGYATQSWVQQQGYATQSDLDGRINDLINGAPAAYDTLKEIADVLEGNVDSIGDILTALGGKADKATTLAGYGIKDAYTKTEIDEELAKYVTIATPQTITGAKTFSGDVVLGGGGAKAFLPSTAGAGIYSIVFDAESAVDGEVPTESGIDMAAVWAALGTAGTEQIDASHLSGALASYVTQTALSSGLATKVDKVSGMGLSSNDFTDALMAKLNGIEAGANRYVLPTASSTVLGGVKIGANITISNGVISTHAPYVHPSATERNIEAATGRVLSAIVVNSLGHVTSVSYKALAAADIPNLSWAKITSGKPTTLEGYGITDGVNDVSFSGAGNAVTEASVDKHVLRLERNTTFVDISSGQTISGKKIFSGDAVFGSGSGRLFLPSTAGAGIYSLVFDAESAVDGETPSEGFGLDEAAMWTALGGSVSNKVIAIEHIPTIPTSKITGLDNALASYATRTWVQQQGYLTSVSLATISDLHSSWDALLKVAPTKYVTRWPTASEVGALTQATADGRYAIQANDNNLISHSNEFNVIPAGFSDVVWFNYRAKGGTGSISQYIFARGSAVGGEYAELLGSNFIADGGAGFVKRMHTDTSNFETGPVWDNSYGTSHLAAIGYWNTTQKVFINPCYNEVTNVWSDAVGKYNFVVGKNFLTYNTYPILHSGNIGSYALTPSNYASTLDSRYVNISGDTMTGPLKYILHGNRYLTLSDSGLHWDFSDVTGGHAEGWLYVTEPDGSQYTGMGVYGATDGLNYLYIGGSYTAPWIVLRPSGNVGIGTSSPAYKLDVAGTLRATGRITASAGVQIGTVDDYGWYIGTGTRISAGISAARGVNVGNLLVSNLWADYTKVPTNGIYSKGDIWTGGKLYIPSSQGNNVFDAYIA